MKIKHKNTMDTVKKAIKLMIIEGRGSKQDAIECIQQSMGVEKLAQVPQHRLYWLEENINLIGTEIDENVKKRTHK